MSKLHKKPIEITEKAAARNNAGLYLQYDSKDYDPVSALSNFSKCFTLEPTECSYIFHYAECFLENNEYACCIAFYKLLISTISSQQKSNSNFLINRLNSIHYLYSQVLLDMKRYKEALNMLNYVLEQNYNVDNVLMRQVFAHIGLKNLNEAVEILCFLIKRNPKDADAIALRARIYICLGNVDFVNIDLESIIKIDKNHISIPNLKKHILSTAMSFKNEAASFMMKADYPLSVILLSRAIELDKEDWSCVFKRGVILAEMGDFESSIIDLKSALDQIALIKKTNVSQISDTKQQSVWDHLGSVYNQMGISAFK